MRVPPPTRLDRRSLLRSGALAAALPIPAGGAPRKKVALLATVIHKFSHAQHFVDRLLSGYGLGGKHHHPQLDLVSLYVDQFPQNHATKNDLTHERLARFPGVRLYPTVAQALTRGGSKLAVDGVLIIGEHGDYPDNAKGQKLYPRHRFFQETVKVFQASGRAVPVFNDKHLSWSWDESLAMYRAARRLGFPFQAGSSLPVTRRIPAVEVPHGAALEESVCVAYGGVDSYDIHALEAAQAMSERRAGGERGVRRVHAQRGARVWAMLRERPATAKLIEAAMSRSHQITPPEGYTSVAPTVELAERRCNDPVAYFVEHRDGFRTTMLLANGLVRDFTYAGRLKGRRVISCQMYLPMPVHDEEPGLRITLADFFNPQIHHFEQMVLTGKAPYPLERTLLTSGVTSFGIESLYRGQVPLDTPELDIPYTAPAASTYWRV